MMVRQLKEVVRWLELGFFEQDVAVRLWPVVAVVSLLLISGVEKVPLAGLSEQWVSQQVSVDGGLLANTTVWLFGVNKVLPV